MNTAHVSNKDRKAVEHTIRATIAARIAASVNGGENVNLPVELDVFAIAEVAQEGPQTKAVKIFHRLLDYVLYTRKRGEEFVQRDTLLAKVHSTENIVRARVCVCVCPFPSVLFRAPII